MACKWPSLNISSPYACFAFIQKGFLVESCSDIPGSVLDINRSGRSLSLPDLSPSPPNFVWAAKSVPGSYHL